MIPYTVVPYWYILHHRYKTVLLEDARARMNTNNKVIDIGIIDLRH